VELRYLRFAYVRGVGLLGERVLGPLRLRHVLYLFLAVLALWRGLGGYPQLLALATALGLLTLASALYPPRSTTFEAYLLALVLSATDLLAGRRAARGKSGIGPASTRAKVGEVPRAPRKVLGDRYAAAGVALAVLGGACVVAGVVLRWVLIVLAGGLPLGLGLALLAGRYYGRR
jgi:hypothetical protein